MRQHTNLRVVAVNDKRSTQWRRAAKGIPQELHLTVLLHEFAGEVGGYGEPLRIEFHWAFILRSGRKGSSVGIVCAAAVGFGVPSGKDIAVACHGAGCQRTTVLNGLLLHRASAAIGVEGDVLVVIICP